MKKNHLITIAKIHMLFIIPIAIVNIIGILSDTLYEGIFAFIIVSILNIVMIVSILLQLLKNTGSKENQKLSFINLAIVIILAMGTFLKHIFLLAN